MFDLRDILYEKFEFERKSEDGAECEMKTSEFKISRFTLFSICFAAALYVVDIGSDWFVAVSYALQGEIWYSSVTFVFIIMPSIYITINERFTGKYTPTTCKDIYMTILSSIFNLEPLIQYWSNFQTARAYLRANQDDKPKYIKQYIIGINKSAYQKLLETYFETISQLSLQIYLFIMINRIGTSQRGLDWSNITTLFQIASISSSAAGIALTHFTAHKAYILSKNYFVTVIGCIFYAIGKGLQPVCQIIIIICLLTIYPWIALGIMTMNIMINNFWYCMMVAKKGENIVDVLYWGALAGSLATLTARNASLPIMIIAHIIILTRGTVMTVVCCLENSSLIPFVVSFLVLDLLCRVISVLYCKYGKKYITKLKC